MDPAAGKRTGRQWTLNQVTAGGKLLHLFDRRSRTNFLVDTGAERSVLPFKSQNSPAGPHLVTASGATIPAWGTRKTTVQFGDDSFTFTFVLAAIAYPILGADFLAHHHLLVDLPGHSPSPAGFFNSIRTIAVPGPHANAVAANTRPSGFLPYRF